MVVLTRTGIFLSISVYPYYYITLFDYVDDEGGRKTEPLVLPIEDVFGITCHCHQVAY